jgi:putative hydrolase of the HAD superfamily
MDTSGLRPYCDIVVVSGDVGVHKPDPALFAYTAEKLGLKTNECVYVGDHPVNDIQGALDSGMKAIRMNWGWFKDKSLRPDVPTITNILDVLNYV